MTLELKCDSCGFERTFEEDREGYAAARDHERDHPSHFVFITGGR
ncbi:hypothetical protein [Natronobacterium lacisalsi]|nr:hypothetical protein [Halobiforma lacisalsi]